ncbi:MAG TPA: hypothetical protein VEJ20_04185, partial [Candidatus Eremiobacteraceae bacterium]|nr:hypothetical protein [Candidatus Eremiobacteraceae bacterium]
VMVAADPGRKWKRVALERIDSCDVVLRNHAPGAGDVPAPEELASSDPVDCDLASYDAGTRWFMHRVAQLVDARAAAR